jgi:hypothetical protein
MPIDPNVAAQLGVATLSLNLAGVNPDLGSSDQLEPGLYKCLVKDISLEKDKPGEDGTVRGSGVSFKLALAVIEGKNKGAQATVYIGIDASDTDDGKRARDKFAALLQSVGYKKEEIIGKQIPMGAVEKAVRGKECYYKLTEGGKVISKKTNKEVTTYYRDFVSKEFFLQHQANEIAAANGQAPAKQNSAPANNASAAPAQTAPAQTSGFPAAATPNGAPNNGFALDMGALGGNMPGANTFGS